MDADEVKEEPSEFLMKKIMSAEASSMYCEHYCQLAKIEIHL